MASPVANHLSTGSNPSIGPAREKRKKRKPASLYQYRDKEEGHKRWRSDKQQRMYSTKLIQALRQVRASSGSSALSAPRRGRAVREAADRALAIAARGRTLWSRAILTNRIKLKFRKQKRQRAAAPSAGITRSRKPKVSVLRLKGKSAPAMQRRVRVLSRLVPGCRKQAFPVILEEATDYIAALQMQIRAMTSLTELLSGHTSSGAGSSSGAPTT